MLQKISFLIRIIAVILAFVLFTSNGNWITVGLSSVSICLLYYADRVVDKAKDTIDNITTKLLELQEQIKNQ